VLQIANLYPGMRVVPRGDPTEKIRKPPHVAGPHWNRGALVLK